MIQLVLWEQKIFEFGLEIQSPFALPLPSIEWGGAKFPLVAQCPGAAFCGNPKPSVHCAVSKVINIPIPKFGITLPTLTIAIPSFKFKFVFPPKLIIPINCPNYPDKVPHPDVVPEVNPLPSIGPNKFGLVVKLGPKGVSIG